MVAIRTIKDQHGEIIIIKDKEYELLYDYGDGMFLIRGENDRKICLSENDFYDEMEED